MHFFQDANYEFIGKIKLCLTISGTIIGIGLLFLVLHRGYNYSIDFTGGMLLQVEFEKVVPADDIRKAIEETGEKGSEVQSLGSPKEVLIRVKQQNESFSIVENVKAKLKEKFPVKEIKREDVVGPKVGKELRDKALLAILYSMVGIMVYIAWRFSPFGFRALVIGIGVIGVLQLLLLLPIPKVYINFAVFIGFIFMCLYFNLDYPTAAVFSLVHDVLVVLAFFSVFNKEVSLTVIAAIMTLIGYSLNDTVVILDRIRENLRIMRSMPYAELINKSINQTLSRTIITASTVFMVSVCLYLFGGEVIKDFAFTMTIGVITGTYSSIYISVPILIYWHNYREKKRQSDVLRRMENK